MAKAKQELTNRTVQGPPDQLLMLPEEAAAYLRVSLGQLYQLTSKKKVPFLKLGAQLRFDRQLLAAWVEERTVGGDAEPLSEVRSGARAAAARTPRQKNRGEAGANDQAPFRFKTPKRKRGR